MRDRFAFLRIPLFSYTTYDCLFRIQLAEFCIDKTDSAQPTPWTFVQGAFLFLVVGGKINMKKKQLLFQNGIKSWNRAKAGEENVHRYY